jgi:hypothetical protein
MQFIPNSENSSLSLQKPTSSFCAGNKTEKYAVEEVHRVSTVKFGGKNTNHHSLIERVKSLVSLMSISLLCMQFFVLC